MKIYLFLGLLLVSLTVSHPFHEGDGSGDGGDDDGDSAFALLSSPVSLTFNS